MLLIGDDRRLAASIQRGLGESGLAVDIVHQGNDGIAAVLSTRPIPGPCGRTLICSAG